MSNSNNDWIKETIFEDIYEMKVSDFLNNLEQRSIPGVDNVDTLAVELTERMFNERAE